MSADEIPFLRLNTFQFNVKSKDVEEISPILILENIKQLLDGHSPTPWINLLQNLSPLFKDIV